MKSSIYNILIWLILTTMIMGGCGFIIRRNHGDWIDIDTIKALNNRLVESAPGQFDSSFTLEVMLDEKACGTSLLETAFWPEWQKYMVEQGYDFVLVTSRADSNDLAYAVQLEQLSVPILVMPGCEMGISTFWNHQSMILKFLLNNKSGDYFYTRSTIYDSTQNRKFMLLLDSLVGAWGSDTKGLWDGGR